MSAIRAKKFATEIVSQLVGSSDPAMIEWTERRLTELMDGLPMYELYPQKPLETVGERPH